MPNNATPADADLILKLYDLRREAEMRKARKYMIETFWPQSFDDVKAVVTAFGSPEQTYMRQVAGYWEMAASLVLHGSLNADLFLDNASEMLVIYVKLRPFLQQMREGFQSPDMLANIEKVIESSPRAQEKVRSLEQRRAMWAELRKNAEKGKAA